MKKHLYIIAAVFTVTAAQAQDDISKQLEVTKAYTPKVGQAAKLSVEPNMVDTVRLHPDSRYQISPTAWATTFGSNRFAPAEISTAAFDRHHSLYVRAGAGVPLQTTADFYFTPRMSTGSTFGLFVNHRGSYSKIRNDIGLPNTSVEMYNGVGIFGGKQFRRHTLRGGLSYDNRHYQPYGVAIPPDSPSGDIPQKFTFGRYGHPFSLGRVGGNIGFGDDFDDLSRFNFNIGLDAGYAYGGRKQADVDLRLAMAQMFGAGSGNSGRHGFGLTLSERGAIDIADGSRSAFTAIFAPRYIMRLNRFCLDAGFDANWVSNEAHDQHNVVIAPVIEAVIDLAGGRFVPFFSYTSQLLDGSFEALSRRNPYLIPTYTAPTGWSRDLRIGFSGALGNVFTYKLSGGASLLRGYHIFIARQDISMDSESSDSDPAEGGGLLATYVPVMFAAGSSDGMRFTAGAEFGLRNLGGFSAKLYGNWNGFDLKKTLAGDLPKYDAGVQLGYAHKDKFTVTAGVQLIGDREYDNSYTVSTLAGQGPPVIDTGAFVSTLSPVVDISLGAEAKVAHDFWVFLEGRNLAGQQLYPYNHYRGLGANVMAGVRAVF